MKTKLATQFVVTGIPTLVILDGNNLNYITNNGKNEMRSWDYLRDKKDNITVIPCCADLDHFDFRKNIFQ